MRDPNPDRCLPLKILALHLSCGAVCAGLSAAGIYIGALSMRDNPRGEEYRFFTSKKGAGVGAISGGLSYAIYSLTLFSLGCLKHYLRKNVALNVGYGFSIMLSLASNLLLSALVSETLNYGDPWIACLSQLYGALFFYIPISIVGSLLLICLSHSLHRFSIWTRAVAVSAVSLTEEDDIQLRNDSFSLASPLMHDATSENQRGVVMV